MRRRLRARARYRAALGLAQGDLLGVGRHEAPQGGLPDRAGQSSYRHVNNESPDGIKPSGV